MKATETRNRNVTYWIRTIVTYHSFGYLLYAIMLVLFVFCLCFFVVVCLFSLLLLLLLFFWVLRGCICNYYY